MKQNEETSCLKIVHFYEEEEGIPSELEANWRSTWPPTSSVIFNSDQTTLAVLDEAFPEITVDLVRFFHSYFAEGVNQDPRG